MPFFLCLDFSYVVFLVFSLSLIVSLFWIPIKLLLTPCFPVIWRKKTENIWWTPLFSLYFSLAPLAIEKRKLRFLLRSASPRKENTSCTQNLWRTGKWNMQTILQSLRFLQTEEDFHKPVEEEYAFPNTKPDYKPLVNKIFQKFLNMSKTDFPSMHSKNQLTIFAESFEKIAQGRYLAWKLLPSCWCLTN